MKASRGSGKPEGGGTGSSDEILLLPTFLVRVRDLESRCPCEKTSVEGLHSLARVGLFKLAARSSKVSRGALRDHWNARSSVEYLSRGWPLAEVDSVSLRSIHTN